MILQMLVRGMVMQPDVFGHVRQELEEVNRILKEAMKLKVGHVSELLEIDFNQLDLEMYPGVLLTVAKMLGVNGPKVVGLAAVVEFIHLASIVHVYDEGYPAFPVLIGDYLYTKFFLLLCNHDNLEALRSLSEAICDLNEAAIVGQQFVNGRGKGNIKQVLWKQGSLMGETCRLAGWLGDASTETQEALKLFGNHLGVLFLLKDRPDQIAIEPYLEGARAGLRNLPDPSKRDSLLRLVQVLIPKSKLDLLAI